MDNTVLFFYGEKILETTIIVSRVSPFIIFCTNRYIRPELLQPQFACKSSLLINRWSQQVPTGQNYIAPIRFNSVEI